MSEQVKSSAYVMSLHNDMKHGTLTSTLNKHSHVKRIDQTRAFPFLLLLCKCETLSPFGKRNKITSKSPSLIKPVRRTLASLDNQREKDINVQNPSNAHQRKRHPYPFIKTSSQSPRFERVSTHKVSVIIMVLLIVGLLCFNSFL